MVVGPRKRPRAEPEPEESPAQRLRMDEQARKSREIQELLSLVANNHDLSSPDKFIPLTPIEYYIHFQVRAAMNAINYIIRTTAGTTQDLYDVVDNAQKLYRFMLKHGITQSVAERLSTSVVNMATAASKADQLQLIDLLNMNQLIEKYNTEFEYAIDRPDVNYIPKLGGFEKVEFLGKGGFGGVYRVCHKDSNIHCVLKIINSNKFEHYDKAAIDKITASVIKSPFLIKYLASFQSREAYITLLEYAHGIDAQRCANYMGTFPLPAIQEFACQFVVAVEHLHLRGLIHLDIKSENVLIQDNGRVKLFDFDLVRLCQGHFLKRPLQRYFLQTAIEFYDGRGGTRGYIPPEYYLGRCFGRSSDWWAVGVVIFRLTIGALPVRPQNCTREFFKNDYQSRNFFATLDQTNAAIKFAKEMLHENPKIRLGSKSYNDIKNHTIFNGINWNHVYNARPSHWTQLIETVSQVRNNEDPHIKAGVANIERQLQYKLQDLNDEPDKSAHIPLVTYISGPFKNFMCNFLDPPDVEQDKVYEQYWPSDQEDIEERLFDYTSHEGDEDSLLGPEIMHQIRIATKKIEFEIDDDQIENRWFGYDHRPVEAPNGRQYPMVTRVHDLSRAKNADLQECDIIHSIMEREDDDEHSPVIHKFLIIEVYLQNPFRVALKTGHFVNLYQRTQSVRVDLTTTILLPHPIYSTSTYQFPMVVKFRQAYSETIRRYVRYCLFVNFREGVSIKPRCREGLYAGDVIAAFNVSPCIDITPQDFQKIITTNVGDNAVLMVSPLSVLRHV